MTVLLTPDPSAQDARRQDDHQDQPLRRGRAAPARTTSVASSRVYTPLYLRARRAQADRRHLREARQQGAARVLARRTQQAHRPGADGGAHGPAGAYKYKLRDRTAYAIFIAALPWLTEQIERTAPRATSTTWADGLSGRARRRSCSHPLTAAAVDLLDEVLAGAGGERRVHQDQRATARRGEQPGGVSAACWSRPPTRSSCSTGTRTCRRRFSSRRWRLRPTPFTAIDSQVAPNGDKGVPYAGTELARERDPELLKEQEGAGKRPRSASCCATRCSSDGRRALARRGAHRHRRRRQPHRRRQPTEVSADRRRKPQGVQRREGLPVRRRRREAQPRAAVHVIQGRKLTARRSTDA